MNYESTKWSRDAIDDVVVDDEALAKKRRRRRIIIAVIALLAVAVIAVMMLGGRGEKAAAPQADQGQQLPAVTVAAPGRTQVDRIITATGSLAARRDMPVGVPGSGGQVVRVLVEPGQWVGAGQVLAVIDRSVQAQTAAQLAAQIEVARADLQLAQNNLDRAQSLVGRGFISRADLDQKRSTRDAAAARVRVAQAQLAATRAQIGQLDVRAPTAGLVLTRSVEAGQVVGPGSGALFRIAAGGEMELMAMLAQDDLAQINVGTIAQVTPVGSPQSYQGAVWQVAPVVDPQTRQGAARILVPYNRELRPGGFAQAQIHAGTTTAPMLPESAIQADDHGNFVYIVDDHNTVVRRPVTIGEVTDHGVSVVQGLTGNERVVLMAGAFLNPGQKVRPELARPTR
ncbi:MAG: efflux RND transporter periplasmic adaptor subunit [Sphingomonadaceae bacterium]|nr:efflux RND transporter periplasmic adaptor subunit [Sphingomonadaceae bacterium]